MPPRKRILRKVRFFTLYGEDGGVEDAGPGAIRRMFGADSYSCTTTLSEGAKAVEAAFVDMPAFSQSCQAGGMTVTLSAKEGVLPAGT